MSYPRPSAFDHTSTSTNTPSYAHPAAPTSAASTNRARQHAHLHAQLATLHARLADTENLLRMTAVQAEYIRGLGGWMGSLCVENHTLSLPLEIEHGLTPVSGWRALDSWPAPRSSARRRSWGAAAATPAWPATLTRPAPKAGTSKARKRRDQGLEGAGAQRRWRSRRQAQTTYKACEPCPDPSLIMAHEHSMPREPL